MDQSVPSIVERYLNDRASGKALSFEVVNTGTSSYSPTIFYVLVRYVLMDYSPDLIVVVVDMTDDFDDWKYSRTLIVDEEGNPWAVPARDPYSAAFVDTGERVVKADFRLRLQLFLARHSYTYNLVQRLVAPKEDASPPAADHDELGDEIYERWSWCQRDWDDLTRRNVAHTLDLLERLAAFCHANGVKVMFTAVPHYRQYAGRPDGTGTPAWSRRPHDEIARVANENGVPCLNSLDALAPFIVGTPQERYYYHRDMHFNPRGYRIWAEAHIKFISDRDNGLLPEEFY
jgi:lysophospholipase L1-like esterase